MKALGDDTITDGKVKPDIDLNNIQKWFKENTCIDSRFGKVSVRAGNNVCSVRTGTRIVSGLGVMTEVYADSGLAVRASKWMKTRNPCDGKLHATVAGSWVDVSIYIAVLVKPICSCASHVKTSVCVCVWDSALCKGWISGRLGCFKTGPPADSGFCDN